LRDAVAEVEALKSASTLCDVCSQSSSKLGKQGNTTEQVMYTGHCMQVCTAADIHFAIESSMLPQHTLEGRKHKILTSGEKPP